MWPTGVDEKLCYERVSRNLHGTFAVMNNYHNSAVSQAPTNILPACLRARRNFSISI